MITCKMAEIRFRNSLTLTELSEKLNIRLTTLSKMEKNQTPGIPLTIIGKLCEEFNCQIEDIYEYQPDNNKYLETRPYNKTEKFYKHLEERNDTEYQKSKLTEFAKSAASLNALFLNSIDLSEDIINKKIGQDILKTEENELSKSELLLEVSKRFARHTKEQRLAQVKSNAASMEEGEQIIKKIIDCCLANNWFGY